MHSQVNFPDLLLDEKVLISVVESFIIANKSLEKELDTILLNYPFVNRCMASYVISLMFTLTNIELLLISNFKKRVKSNIDYLVKYFKLDSNDVVSLDISLEEVLSLKWSK